MKINPEPVKTSVSPYSSEAREYLKATNEQKKIKKTLKSSLIPLIVISVIVIIIFVFYRFLVFKQKVIVENTSRKAPILTAKSAQDLKADMVIKDGDARINILVTGMGGAGHPGGTLTDSIQIVSLDPINNQAGIVSLPRDLQVVDADKIGRKINTLYQIGEKRSKNGGAYMKREVGKILNLNIHYFINVDFAGFTKLIDKLGGVTVIVDKPISDSLYPDDEMKGYEPFSLKAGTQTMTGEIALKYARSRQTTSDFDRSARQQKLMVAVKEKALSLGTLTNPAKISNILEVIGNHLKTDIQISEMSQLLQQYQKVQADKVQTKVISNSTNGPLVNKSINGSYSLVPKAGVSDYSEVAAVAHSVMIDPMIKKEAAKIKIEYPKNRAAEALKIIDKLTQYGYTISDGGVISSSANQDTIVSRNSKKPFTLQYLLDHFPDATVRNLKENPTPTTSDITISLGKL